MKRNINKWDQWNASGTPIYPHNKLIQFMFRNFPQQVRKNIKVLDLGCGSGVNCVFLVKEGFQTYATDISSVAVNNTKKLLEKNKLKLQEIKIEEISKISFQDVFFDCVVSIGVFDAAGISESIKSVIEINRILKPGGIAFLLFAACDDFRMENNVLNLHGYNDEEVRKLSNVSLFKKVYIDHYKTTHANQTFLQHDYIITLFK